MFFTTNLISISTKPGNCDTVTICKSVAHVLSIFDSFRRHWRESIATYTITLVFEQKEDLREGSNGTQISKVPEETYN
jgi:hypothetical protein